MRRTSFLKSSRTESVAESENMIFAIKKPTNKILPLLKFLSHPHAILAKVDLFLLTFALWLRQCKIQVHQPKESIYTGVKQNKFQLL